MAALAPSLPACSDCDLEITTTSLPNGSVGVPYASVVTTSCGGDEFFLEGGTLPPGIGLLDNGQLRGTPTQIGVFNFSVGVVDFDFDEAAFQGLSITVDPS